RICMVALRHTLDDARVVHKQAATLRRAGHEVLLLFSCDSDWRYRRQDGAVLTTGSAPDGEAMYAGFKVFGRPKRPLRKKYLQFRELVRVGIGLEADVYHAHEPDMALAVAIRSARGLAAAGRQRSLVVHDMHEYPPGGLVDSSGRWTRPLVHAAARARDTLLARGVDHVFTANSVVRGYALLLSRSTPVDVLYNGPSLELFPQAEAAAWRGAPEPLIVSHEGSLGFGRGLKEMIAAVDRLRDRVHLRIIGDVFGKEREWLNAE